MNFETLHDALANRRTIREFTDRPVSLDIVKRLLWAAQGISDGGGRRTAPSAHALHPLRLYLTAGGIDGLATAFYSVDPGVWEFKPLIVHDIRGDLQEAAVDDQPWIGHAAGIVTICADMADAARHFADQPPYGTRGNRYAYLEAGAAAQNLHLQATAEGLGCVLVGGFHDEATASVMTLAPPIQPIAHMCFGWPHIG